MYICIYVYTYAHMCINAILSKIKHISLLFCSVLQKLFYFALFFCIPVNDWARFSLCKAGWCSFLRTVEPDSERKPQCQGDWNGDICWQETGTGGWQGKQNEAPIPCCRRLPAAGSACPSPV